MAVLNGLDFIAEAFPGPRLIVILHPARRSSRSEDRRLNDPAAPGVAMHFPGFGIGQVQTASISAGFHGIVGTGFVAVMLATPKCSVLVSTLPPCFSLQTKLRERLAKRLKPLSDRRETKSAI